MAEKEIVKDDSSLSRPAIEVRNSRKRHRTARIEDVVSMLKREAQADQNRASAPTHVDLSQFDEFQLRLYESVHAIACGSYDSQFDSTAVMALMKRLRNVVAHTRSCWKNMEGIPYLPLHGSEHHVLMVNVLARFFSEQLSELSDDELCILIAAIFLHDIGMAVRLSTGEAHDSIVDSYHETSAAYVMDHYYELGLSEEHAGIVGNLCQFHRSHHDLNQLTILDRGHKPPVNRQKLLLAYLRLADMLEIGPDRVKGQQQHLALYTTKPLPRDIYSEWFRNLFVSGISIDTNTLAVEIRYRPEWGQEKIHALISTIERDLQAALAKVKDILIVEGKLMLLWVRARTGSEPTPDLLPHLQDALNSLELAASPNAGRVAHGVMTSLLDRLKTGGYDSAVGYLRREMREVIDMRANYSLVKYLYEKLLSIMDSSMSEVDKLEKMKAVVLKSKQDRERALVLIAKYAATTFAGECRFLVSGYSACVLAALKGLTEKTKEKSRVYVAETRNKTRYGLDNLIDYCDGFVFGRAIESLGFENRVTLVSDASVASLYEEREKDKPVLPTHVLLGANGISRTGKVSTTVGFLSVAVIAKHYHVPLYVLAEGGKIGKEIGSGERDRENNWLTSDPSILLHLNHGPEGAKKKGLKLFRPSEDEVPADLITAFITEKGVLSPERLEIEYPEDPAESAQLAIAGESDAKYE